MKSKNRDVSSIIKGEGTVIRNTGSSYVVRLDSGEETSCRVKGNFRIRGIRTTNPVAVGDRVTVAGSAEDADYITAISPRRNYIIRRASNLSRNPIFLPLISIARLWLRHCVTRRPPQPS